jgi:hypothetical protein
MFPPRADAAVSWEIIQFSAIAGLSKKDRKQIARAAILGRPSRVEIEQVQPGRDKGETITFEKQASAGRAERRLARGRFDPGILESALGNGERDFVRSETRSARRQWPSPHNPDDRWAILANWRQAIAQQLLTPAPDTAAVAWKKAALAVGQHEHTDVKTERIERAIASDLEFLAAHPTRRLRPAPKLVTSWSAGADRPKSVTGNGWRLTQGGSGGKQRGAGSGPRLSSVVRQFEIMPPLPSSWQWTTWKLARHDQTRQIRRPLAIWGPAWCM